MLNYMPDISESESPRDLAGNGASYADGGKYEASEGQLAAKMAPFVKDGFAGVKASNELSQLKPAVMKGDRIGFIVNKSPRGTPGSHWVAVYISWTNNKHHAPEVDYFDPLGDPPSPGMRRALAHLVKTRAPPQLLKFKVNRVPNQSSQSSTCGYQAVRFLQDMFAGKSFKDATNFSVGQGESAARQLAGGALKRFGYI